MLTCTVSHVSGSQGALTTDDATIGHANIREAAADAVENLVGIGDEPSGHSSSSGSMPPMTDQREAPVPIASSPVVAPETPGADYGASSHTDAPPVLPSPHTEHVPMVVDTKPAEFGTAVLGPCLLYTSPSPRDRG